MSSNASTPLFLADQLALDFVNSAYGLGDAHVEHFRDADGVLDWLRTAGLPAPALDEATGRRLFDEAVSLRSTARELVEHRKRGERGDPAGLNRLLAKGSRWTELVWADDGLPVVEARQRAELPEALLLPVAESLAKLLADANFELVRKCEAHDCTLWFHDRTKAHHRRWCSQALCGNRMKVAAFRARKRG